MTRKVESSVPQKVDPPRRKSEPPAPKPAAKPTSSSAVPASTLSAQGQAQEANGKLGKGWKGVQGGQEASNPADHLISAWKPDTGGVSRPPQAQDPERNRAAVTPGKFSPSRNPEFGKPRPDDALLGKRSEPGLVSKVVQAGGKVAEGATKVATGKTREGLQDVQGGVEDGLHAVAPGLAKKGGVPPGQAKKGGEPPGQAKKDGEGPVARLVDRGAGLVKEGAQAVQEGAQARDGQPQKGVARTVDAGAGLVKDTAQAVQDVVRSPLRQEAGGTAKDAAELARDGVARPDQVAPEKAGRPDPGPLREETGTPKDGPQLARDGLVKPRSEEPPAHGKKGGEPPGQAKKEHDSGKIKKPELKPPDKPGEAPAKVGQSDQDGKHHGPPGLEKKGGEPPGHAKKEHDSGKIKKPELKPPDKTGEAPAKVGQGEDAQGVQNGKPGEPPGQAVKEHDSGKIKKPELKPPDKTGEAEKPAPAPAKVGQGDQDGKHHGPPGLEKKGGEPPGHAKKEHDSGKIKKPELKPPDKTGEAEKPAPAPAKVGQGEDAQGVQNGKPGEPPVQAVKEHELPGPDKARLEDAQGDQNGPPGLEKKGGEPPGQAKKEHDSGKIKKPELKPPDKPGEAEKPAPAPAKVGQGDQDGKHHGPPGLEKKGGEPPGQAKKEHDSGKIKKPELKPPDKTGEAEKPAPVPAKVGQSEDAQGEQDGKHHGPPGLEKKGGEPPGQAKKEHDSGKIKKPELKPPDKTGEAEKPAPAPAKVGQGEDAQGDQDGKHHGPPGLEKKGGEPPGQAKKEHDSGKIKKPELKPPDKTGEAEKPAPAPPKVGQGEDAQGDPNGKAGEPPGQAVKEHELPGPDKARLEDAQGDPNGKHAGPPGLEKKGGEPPGQAKKEHDSGKIKKPELDSGKIKKPELPSPQEQAASKDRVAPATQDKVGQPDDAPKETAPAHPPGEERESQPGLLQKVLHSAGDLVDGTLKSVGDGLAGVREGTHGAGETPKGPAGDGPPGLAKKGGEPPGQAKTGPHDQAQTAPAGQERAHRGEETSHQLERDPQANRPEPARANDRPEYAPGPAREGSEPSQEARRVGEAPQTQRAGETPRAIPEAQRAGETPRTTPEAQRTGETTPEAHRVGETPRTSPEAQRAGETPRTTPEAQRAGETPRAIPEAQRTGETTPEARRAGETPRATPEARRTGETTPEARRVGDTPRTTPEARRTGETPRTTPEAQRTGETPRTTPGDTPRTTPEAQRTGETPRTTPEARRTGETPRTTPEAQRTGETPRTTPEARRTGETTPEARRTGETTPEARRAGETTPEARPAGETPRAIPEAQPTGQAARAPGETPRTSDAPGATALEARAVPEARRGTPSAGNPTSRPPSEAQRTVGATTGLPPESRPDHPTRTPRTGEPLRSTPVPERSGPAIPEARTISGQPEPVAPGRGESPPAVRPERMDPRVSAEVVPVQREPRGVTPGVPQPGVIEREPIEASSLPPARPPLQEISGPSQLGPVDASASRWVATARVGQTGPEERPPVPPVGRTGPERDEKATESRPETPRLPRPRSLTSEPAEAVEAIDTRRTGTTRQEQLEDRAERLLPERENNLSPTREKLRSPVVKADEARREDRVNEAGAGQGGDSNEGATGGDSDQSDQQKRSPQQTEARREGANRAGTGATAEQQQPGSPARRIVVSRESYQLSLRKLDLMAATRTTDAVVSRHVSHSITSVLRRVYRQQEIESMDQETAVNSLGVLLKLGGDFTFDHSSRVLDLAVGLADQVGITDRKTLTQVRYGALLKDIGDVGLRYNYQSDETLDQVGDFLKSQDVRRAGLLHDIGKTRIPNSILYKAGKLTEHEFQIMKMHPVYGEEMVYPIPSLRHLCPAIRSHHERWDGQGYPDGLRAEQIPLPARIIAVADVFDALSAPRPYKPGMPVEEVWNVMRAGRGTHFDPMLLDAFRHVLRGRYPHADLPL